MSGLEVERRRRLARTARMLQTGTTRELSALLAHDLSQPITVILSYASACAEAPITPTADALLETMKIIAGEANRAAGRLQWLKDSIRRLPRARSSLDPNDLVRDALALFDDAATETGVDVRLDLAPDIPAIEGDAIQMQQVFVSLVGNAFEAMATAPERVLRIRTARLRGDHEVEVTVRDSGAGFGADVAERLFERFYTTKAARLGIGLSIARSIVEGHGGKIWAESGAGSGATFGVRLPVAQGGEPV